MIEKRIDRINGERNGTKIIGDSEIGASDRSARALLQSYRWARLTALCPSGRVLRGLAFDRHEAHGRVLHGFANRLGVSSVVLLPLYKRLEIGPRDQPHDMAELAEFATPVC